jgi:hypothetical protein
MVKRLVVLLVASSSLLLGATTVALGVTTTRAQPHTRQFSPLKPYSGRTYKTRTRAGTKSYAVATAYPEAYARGEIENALEQAFPGVYAGTDLAGSGSTIIVYVTNDSPALAAAATQYAPSSALEYVTVSRSLDQLNAVSDQIAAAFPELESEGIDVVYSSLDFANNAVDLDVLDPTATAIATLNSDFGAGNIHVTGVSHQVVSFDSGRNSDTSPFNGGDNILSATWTWGSSEFQGQCGSGYGITLNINGSSHFITAGHCMPPSTDEYNQICSTGGFCSTTGTSMGDISSNDTTPGGTDSELSTAEGSDVIFGGAIGHPDVIPVTEHVGVTEYEDDLCASGALSGEVCTLEVTSDPQATTCVDATDWYTDGQPWTHYVCDLIQVTNNDSMNQGGVVWGDGDSGSPVYVPSGTGDAYATGTISAGTGTKIACPANTWRGKVCTSVGYYTSLSSELAHWNATLNLY